MTIQVSLGLYPLRVRMKPFPSYRNGNMHVSWKLELQVGTYRTDNGELKSEEMQKWLATKGMKHEFTVPHTSAHNGHVEQMHRTLMVKARTMHIYASLPVFLWDKLYLTASHLHAKTTTCSLNGRTLWELWHSHQPDYLYMQEIGCKAYVLIQNQHNPKIHGQSIECVLVGYEPNSKSY